MDKPSSKKEKQGIILRIQNKDGIGPFDIFDGPFAKNSRDFISEKEHPTAPEDPVLWPQIEKKWKQGYWPSKGRDRLVFGFETPESLQSWFYKEEHIDALETHGFFLIILKGTVYHGSRQSVLNLSKPHETLLEMPLKEFLKNPKKALTKALQ